MSSVEPEYGGDELDCGEESAGELVVAGCDSAEVFEIAEEALDEVTLAIEGEIGGALDNAVCLGRDDGGDAASSRV